LDGGHSQTCSPIVSIASGSGFVVMAFIPATLKQSTAAGCSWPT
jgi:hypothetical protein